VLLFYSTLYGQHSSVLLFYSTLYGQHSSVLLFYSALYGQHSSVLLFYSTLYGQHSSVLLFYSGKYVCNTTQFPCNECVETEHNKSIQLFHPTNCETTQYSYCTVATIQEHSMFKN
jgi:hypothetical protein